MTKNKIILNWMPPATLNFASPSLSALKSYLTKFDYEVKIVYWNLKLAELQCGFLWLKTPDFYDDEMRSLLLFFNYIAIKRNDTNAYNQVKGILIAIKPQYLTRDIDVYDLHMKAYADELDCYIDDILSKIDDSNILYYGMSVMFYQWIFSSILAEKIKIKNQESKIIIGGISSKESAVAYLESFDQFDFALWGESEINLEILSKELIENNENIDFDKLLNTAFRKNDKIKISKHRKCNYIDFSNDKSIFDISDYFEQKKIIDEIFNDQIKERIPIEGARGCHWKKCNFCYLNTGYKYRLKPVSLIIYEIKKQISKYNVFSFCFLDNDLVGLDKERFKHLLDELIEIKKVYPNFSIDMAEVITNGIDSSIIRKMFFAGFESVQIGYESPSNSLLKKIRKKNSFASNLLFIKFAQVYNIGISGANVIMGLLEETDNDIIEAIKNLHHLRFFLLRGRFRHSYTSLGIMHTSSYYDKLENKIEHLSRNQIIYLLPNFFLKKNDPELHILPAFDMKNNMLWNQCRQVEEYYLNHRYHYELWGNTETTVLYRERSSGKLINELEFEIFSVDWFILRKCNDQIMSFEELFQEVKITFREEFPELEIINILEELQAEKLIYVTSDYLEIFTIINTNSVN